MINSNFSQLGGQIKFPLQVGPSALPQVKKPQGPNDKYTQGTSGSESVTYSRNSLKRAGFNTDALPGTKPNLAQDMKFLTYQQPMAVASKADPLAKLEGPMAKHRQAFLDAEEKYGVDSRLLASIAQYQTDPSLGKTEADAAIAKNNLMGIVQRDGSLRRFDSASESINFSAKLMSESPFYRGRNTLSSISKVYGGGRSPIQDFERRVTQNFRALGGNPQMPVK